MQSRKEVKSNQDELFKGFAHYVDRLKVGRMMGNGVDVLF